VARIGCSDRSYDDVNIPNAISSHAGASAPYASYAAILAAFGGLLAATAAADRARRDVRPLNALEVTLLAAASFKAARVISRERVGSVVREPFVEGEQPAGGGARRAFGELVTCTRCVGTWAAAGLVATDTAAPRFGRVLTLTLAAGAGNDFLQAAFAALCNRDGTAPPPQARARPDSRGT
jgi:uncharacterized protein DUF1360